MEDMKNCHATVHDEKTNKIIFEAQVHANTPGEAHNKIVQYLMSIGKPDIAKIGATLTEIGHRCIPDIPLIE
jgi:hypothetical protein